MQQYDLVRALDKQQECAKSGYIRYEFRTKTHFAASDRTDQGSSYFESLENGFDSEENAREERHSNSLRDSDHANQ
jgi:hypothetical protein